MAASRKRRNRRRATSAGVMVLPRKIPAVKIKTAKKPAPKASTKSKKAPSLSRTYMRRPRSFKASRAKMMPVKYSPSTLGIGEMTPRRRRKGTY